MRDLVRSLVHVIDFKNEILLRQLHLTLDLAHHLVLLACIGHKELNRHRYHEKNGTDYRK